MQNSIVLGHLGKKALDRNSSQILKLNVASFDTTPSEEHVTDICSRGHSKTTFFESEKILMMRCTGRLYVPCVFRAYQSQTCLIRDSRH